MNGSKQITYRIDERASPTLKKKMLSYLNRKGDPKNLPPNLFRYFEPADDGGFIALRDKPLPQKRKSFSSKEVVSDEIADIPEEWLSFKTFEDLDGQRNQVEKLFNQVGGLIGRIGNEDIAYSVISALFSLYPNNIISLHNSNKLRHSYPSYSCIVIVHGPGNQIEAEIHLTSGHVFFLGPPQMRLSFTGVMYESFKEDPQKILRKELSQI